MTRSMRMGLATAAVLLSTANWDKGFDASVPPTVHRPTPTDDARNIEAAKRKRERKQAKRQARQSLQSEGRE